MSKKSPSYQDPTRDEIAACAYSIWEAEGRPEGKEITHWFQAETHLIAARKMDAGLFKNLVIKKSKLLKVRRKTFEKPKLAQVS